MNYRELQKVLQSYKQKGLTDIALNSKKAVLQAELDRIESSEEIEETTLNIDVSQSDSFVARQTVDAFFGEAEGTLSGLKAEYTDVEDSSVHQSCDFLESDDLDWYPDPMRSATPETESYQTKYNGLLTSLIILLIATIKILIVTVFEPLVVLVEGLKQLQLIPPTIPQLLPNCWYRIKPAIV